MQPVNDAEEVGTGIEDANDLGIARIQIDDAALAVFEREDIEVRAVRMGPGDAQLTPAGQSLLGGGEHVIRRRLHGHFGARVELRPEDGREFVAKDEDGSGEADDDGVQGEHKAGPAVDKEEGAAHYDLGAK